MGAGRAVTASWVLDAHHAFPDRKGEEEFEAAGGDVLKATLATIERRRPLVARVEALLHEHGAIAVLEALVQAGVGIPGLDGRDEGDG